MRVDAISCMVSGMTEIRWIFEKSTAGIFYKLMHLLGCRTITNHADYRLMSKKALDALAEFHETNLFLREFDSDHGISVGYCLF